MTSPEPRLLRPDDASAWRALRLHGLVHSPDAFGASPSEEQDQPLEWFAGRLRNTPVFATVDATGALNGTVGLGFMLGAKVRHKAFVWGVYVLPSARRAGLGRALLQAAIGHATGRVEELRLDVGAENAAALGLYRSLGFTAYGTEPRALKLGGTYVDEVLMRLTLPPASAGSG